VTEPGGRGELAEPIALALLDTLASRTAVVDATGTVVAVNALWRDAAPPPPDADFTLRVGDNVLEVFRRGSGPSAGMAAVFADALESVLEGRTDRWETVGDERVEWWGRWHDARIVGLRRPPGGALISHTDVSDEVRFGIELHHWTRHDPLTGLANRATLMERLQAAIERARGGELSLVLIDLDDFSALNEAHGHHVGDQILHTVGERLREGVGAGRTVARFIGDSFVVVVEEGDPVGPAAVADELSALVSRPIGLPDGEVLVTATSAVVGVSEAHASAEALLRHAKAMLRRAKLRGRGSREVDERGGPPDDLDLRGALDHGRFHLLYQAEMSLETGRVIGAEALLRLDHPERGRLAPAEFMEQAEATGLIVPIGTWVIRQATRQAATWPIVLGDVPALFVAVNLSALQLSDPALPSVVAEALAEAGLAADRLCVEITESALFERFDVAVATLGQLRAMGVHVALDDFGTGYSSLAYLRHLPVDVLKIDRSFVARLLEDIRDRVIVEAVVSIARTFGLQVVAEGVERREQLDVLRRLGCDVAQGYDIGRPGEAVDVIALAAAKARHPTARSRLVRALHPR